MPGASNKCLNCEVEASHSGVHENAVLTCDAVSLDQVFSTFRCSATRIPRLLDPIDKVTMIFETLDTASQKTQRHVPECFQIFTVSFERILF
jgi:hypothetical protein